MSLILFGLILAVIGSEIIARIFFPPVISEWAGGLGELHQCDRLVGWRGLPNGAGVGGWDDETRRMHNWNSIGMHDKNHAIEKAEGVFRILMLGDSFVQAVEVEESETSHQVLENLLKQHAPNGVKFEVMSAGILSWGPGQELMFFRQEGKKYKPDLIIGLWYPGNDLIDIMPGHAATLGPTGGVNCYAPYFTICNGQFDPRPWFVAPGIEPTWQDCSVGKKITTNLLNRLYYTFRLYQVLDPRKPERPSEWRILGPWVDHERSDPVINYAYRLTGEIYSQLAAEASTTGAETMLVTVPNRYALDYEINPQIRETVISESPLLKNAYPRLPYERFVEEMTQKGLITLDLYPSIFAHMQAGGENLYHGGHWNVAGNRKVAQLIADQLIAQGLVPVEK